MSETPATPSLSSMTGDSGSSTRAPLRLGVCVSGGGSTLMNLQRQIDEGQLNAEIVCVIASNERAAAKVTERFGHAPVHAVNRRDFDGENAFSQAAWTHLRAAGVDLVCLAGFLSRLNIPDEYNHRVLNIHPALLPAFGGRGMYGRNVHEAVLDHGCKVSGCTVHFADQTYDTGPILVQRSVPVLNHDTPETLAARVFEQECLAYPEAIRMIIDGQWKLEGRRVVMRNP